MNFLASSTEFLCFTGKENMHVVPIKPDISDVHSILLQKSGSSTASSQKQVPKGKASLVCAGLSYDSKYLAAADSEKQLYVYEHISSNTWTLIASLETEKRLLQVQFSHSPSDFLVLSDKCGDVWAISIAALRKQNMPTKILGHCSVVLDTCLNRESSKIFTCDRDEKIRVSNFPDSYIIQGYFLGHKEAVVSISLVNEDNYLLSIDIEGSFKLWRTDSRVCALTVNIFDLLGIETSNVKSKVDYQINMMKCTDAFEKKYFAVRILNCSKVYVLELDIVILSVRLVGDIDAGCNEYDMCWIENGLYIIDLNRLDELIQVQVTDDGKLTNPISFKFSKAEEILSDVKGFVASNQISNIPLRKRVAYDFGDKNKEPLPKVQCMDMDIDIKSEKETVFNKGNDCSKEKLAV